MLALYVFVQSSIVTVPDRLAGLSRSRRSHRGHRGHRGQGGQASAEYALVLLGAAAVALLVTGWAARTNRVGRLLDAVMDQLLDKVK